MEIDICRDERLQGEKETGRPRRRLEVLEEDSSRRGMTNLKEETENEQVRMKISKRI